MTKWDELHRRLSAVHGPRKADRAQALGLLAACRDVYVLAGERREAAENALHEAIAALESARATEDEWRCIVHGQALKVARLIDAGESRALIHDSDE